MNSKICRLCLNEQEILQDIFAHKVQNLSEIILDCTGVEVSEIDGISSSACEECIQNVIRFDSFKKQCQCSDKFLRNLNLKLFVNENKCSVEIIQSDLDIIKSEDDLLLISLECNDVNVKSELLEENSTENPYFSEDNKADYSNSSFDDPNYDPVIESNTSNKNYRLVSTLKRKQRKFKEHKNVKKKNNLQQRHLVYTDEDYSLLEGQRKVRIYKIDDSMREIIGHNVYTCELCLTEFQSFFDYFDHQQTHDGQFRFKCSKCDEVFDSRSDLVEHDSRHKIPCKICKRGILPKSMTAHLLIHTDIHKCLHCGRKHTSNALLERHIQACHSGIKSYVCHICGKQYSGQGSMKRHMAYHSTDRPHKCQYCNFSAKTLNIVQVHTSRIHLAEKCVCEICAKLFKSQPSLIQHMKRIHTIKKHACDICGKGFIGQYNLKTHLKTHVGQMLHECKNCHKEFFSVRKLKEHMHSHRQGCTTCPKCGKEFFYKKYYTKHVLKCTKTLDVIDTVGNDAIDVNN